MRSYLVVGNQTLDSHELAEAVAERVASGPATFHVVVPATPVRRASPGTRMRRAPRPGTT